MYESLGENKMQIQHLPQCIQLWNSFLIENLSSFSIAQKGGGEMLLQLEGKILSAK